MCSILRFFPALLLVIAYMLVVGCESVKDNEVKVLSDRAETLFSEGEFIEAERLYLDAFNIDPHNSQVLARLGTLALWHNDLDRAEIHFNAALKLKSWLGQQWPFSAQLYYYLALIAMREGRWAEAERRLNRAAGPVALGSLKTLKVMARRAGLFRESPAYDIEGPLEVSIPFVMTDPLPVVKVSVNGSAPVNFFIDTGGEGIMLDRNFAKQVGAKLVGSIKGEYAGGADELTDYGRIDSLKIGDMTITALPVSCLDLTSTSTRVFGETEIKGVIGTQFLMQFLSTIDYRHETLVLRQTTKANQTKFYQHLDPDLTYMHPMWLVETHLIFAQGAFNQQAQKMMFIDTGLADAGFLSSKSILTNGGVSLNWDQAKTSPVIGGMVKALNVHIVQIELGGGKKRLIMHNLKGVVFENDISIFKGSLGFHVGGLISHQFFRDTALTFDFKNMHMIIEKHNPVVGDGGL